MTAKDIFSVLVGILPGLGLFWFVRHFVRKMKDEIENQWEYDDEAE